MSAKDLRVAVRLGAVLTVVVVLCAGSFQVAAQCLIHEYLSGGSCNPCALENCDLLGPGLALTVCPGDGTTDVSGCTDCTALGMFVSGDGMSCTGSCPAGEAVVAGAPGDTTCAECATDMFASNGVCEACTHTSASCTADGFALTTSCEMGAASDVSTCADCAAMGMFVSGDGMSCTGGCPAGQAVVAGAPGETNCMTCPVTFYVTGGVCVECEHTPTTCGDDGFARNPCPVGVTFDSSTCLNCTAMGQIVSVGGNGCSGGVSCPTGEAVVPAPPGELACAPCGADTFSENNLCVTCAATAGSCTGDGFALTASCGAGEGSDVSVCTNCTAAGMFVSADGASCIASTCPVGESVVAGPPGDTTCSGCAADMYQSGNSSGCVACAHNSGGCSDAGFAVTASCGVGETSDVSVCTDCAAMGMFVSGDGMSCTGGCPAGQAVVAGAPGETNCMTCPVTFYVTGGVCVECEHTPTTCGDDGFARNPCPVGVTFDSSTCLNCTAMGQIVSVGGNGCSGGVSCPTGEALVPAPPGELACAPCGADTFSENNLCVTCAATAGSCTGDGFALTASCGAGEGSDVSVCTNCTAAGMFVSADGASCIASTCPVGESVVAGPPGDTTCSGCAADMYQSGNSSGCVACAHNSGGCSDAGFAVTASCGVGETSDVSVCTDCAAMGMFVSGDGMSCTGGCPAGQAVVAGAPGETNCMTCPVTFYVTGGVCVECEHTPTTCGDDGFARNPCPVGVTFDSSTCLNCTAMGQIVSVGGNGCSGGVSCPTGEALVPAPPGELACAPCGADTFSENNLCVTCAATAGSCTGDGFALTASCGAGEGSDVSVCTNCTAAGMFVSADGASCIASTCPVGESVVAGPPGDTTCSGCAADMYQSGNSSGCVACAHNSGGCSDAGFAVTASCGVGETSDVSVCTDCAAMGMFVSGDGMSCTGGCPAGRAVVAGAPGDTTCAECAVDMFANNGVCEACTHTSASCSADGLALSSACGMGEVSDVSTCTNCTARFMFVTFDGMSCDGGCPGTEVLVPGPPGAQNCMRCPEHTFPDGGVCVDCEFTPETCNADGFALGACDEGGVSDPSSCTDCASMDMFVSADGASCIASTCPVGESVVAGPPGDTTCSGCAADMYQSGNSSGCVACAHNSGSCSDAGFAVTASCGVGEMSDVSVCTDCAAMGMFVSGDGMSCTGGCPAGQAVVAGAPGETNCMTCPVTFYVTGGVCVECEHTPTTCGDDGFARNPCPVGCLRPHAYGDGPDCECWW